MAIVAQFLGGRPHKMSAFPLLHMKQGPLSKIDHATAAILADPVD